MPSVCASSSTWTSLKPSASGSSRTISPPTRGARSTRPFRPRRHTASWGGWSSITRPSTRAGSTLNRTGFLGAVWLGSGGQGQCLVLGIVTRFRLGWRHVPDRLEQAAVVEPVDPFERGELHRLEGPPGTAPVDHLGLVEAVDGLREGVVKAVADAADRGLNAGLGQPFGVADRDVLLGFKWSSHTCVRRPQRFVKGLGGRSPAQGLAWPAIEGCSHRREVVRTVPAQVSALREVLPQQPVGVLVRAALPWAVRVAKVDRHASLDP